MSVDTKCPSCGEPWDADNQALRREGDKYHDLAEACEVFKNWYTLWADKENPYAVVPRDAGLRKKYRALETACSKFVDRWNPDKLGGGFTPPEGFYLIQNALDDLKQVAKS